MRDLRNDALQLADLGWSVMPLHSPEGDGCDCHKIGCPSIGKHPRIDDWTNNATTVQHKLMTWWTTWPHANIGVLTGPPSGLVVLDVDPRSGGDESIAKLIDEHGQLPWCPAVQTGSGGSHYYLKHPGRLIKSRSGILPGIDVKADGGMVVAPPSVHATGMSYRWFDGYSPLEAVIPVPEIPPWLMAVLVKEEERSAAPPLAETIPEGGRRAALLSLAGSMRRRGAGQGAIFAALMAENAEKCRPPLDRGEVAQIASSAARDFPVEEVPLIVEPKPKTAKPRTQPSTIRMSDLQHEVLPEPKVVVDGLMPVGLALLCGGLKKGKSWLMLGTGIAVAEGGMALGEIPVEDGDVLYIAYEDHKRRLQNRGVTLLGTVGRWPERMEVAPSGHWPGRDEGGLEAIDSWLGQHPKARLVVVDTLQRFRGGGGSEGDKQAYAADYLVSSELQELALKHEVVIVAVHHYRKSLSETDWVDQVSGTNGIAGAADTIMGFDRKRGEQIAILKVTGRDVDEGEFALAFDAARYGWVITGTAEDARIAQEGGEFSQAMWDIGHGGAVHYRQIAEALGIKRNTAYQMGKRLAARGVVLNLGGGMFGWVTPPVQGVDSENRGNGVNVSKSPDLASEIVDMPFDKPLTGVNGGGGPLTGVKGLSTALSKDSESETARFDTLTRKDGFPSTDPDLPPGYLTYPCAECGQVAWVRTVSGVSCGVCRPAVKAVER